MNPAMKTRGSRRFPHTTISLKIKDTDDSPTYFTVRSDTFFHVKTIELVTGASFRGYTNHKIKSNPIWISPNEAVKWISSIDETLGRRVRRRLQRQLGYRVELESEWEPTERMMREQDALLDSSKGEHQVIYGFQLGPKLVKIGRSDLGVGRRIRDLSTRFKGNLVFVVPVKNSTMVEREVFETKEIRHRRTAFTNANHHKTTEVIKLDDKFGMEALLDTVKRVKYILDLERKDLNRAQRRMDTQNVRVGFAGGKSNWKIVKVDDGRRKFVYKLTLVD